MAGITLKDLEELEQNNMALHACKNPASVLINRKKLADFLKCELAQLVCAHQTHSANFHKVTLGDRGKGAVQQETAIANTDALYTFESNVLLGTFTADCVPVLFFDDTTGLTGVIHSGWPGTVKELTLKLFNHLIQVEQCNPIHIQVHIGTAISQRKFEVDEDVYRQFKNLGYADEFIDYNSQTLKYHINNQQTVKSQCLIAGIPADNIFIDPTCTFQNPHGFSYRENKQCGRHLSFIMRKK